MIYIGIDPGKHGAIAYIRNNKVNYFSFSKKSNKDINLYFSELAEMLDDMFAYIEQEGAYPGQGVHSVFVFGENYGMLQGFLVAHDIPFGFVHPKRWKNFMGCIAPKNSTHTEKKNISKSLAQRLYPNIKITHDISEAILLAEYCKRSGGRIKR